MKWKEKIDFQNETFNKNEMWVKNSFINVVKIYGKNISLDVFLISRNEILKSWAEAVNV